jgi:hypothetical protein
MNSLEWIKHPAVQAQIFYGQKRDLEKELAELKARYDALDKAYAKVAIALSEAQAKGTVGTVDGRSLWTVYVEADDEHFDAVKEIEGERHD